MKHSELLSRILIISGILLVLAVPFAAQAIGSQGVIEIQARMAESGGWTPSTVQAKAGVPLHLRLTSDDVVHSFAIGQNHTPPVDVLPGQMIELTVTFDKPGIYTYYCTRWCGPNHWRMRGTIEVSGNNPASPHIGTPPLYLTLNLDIDAAHQASVIPDGIPNTQRGAKFSNKLSAGYLSLDYYRSHSPTQVFLDLRADPTFSTLSDTDIWDLVAYIWQSSTTPERLAEGQRLFAQNCAACHGETGGGNGIFSANIKALTGKTPVNFTDPGTMLGASPALLQGKILRGGMGTGMPSWGSIFENETIWSIIGYIYTFQLVEFQK